MNIIATLKNAVLKKIQGSPGLSQQVDLETVANATDDAEVYHPAGFYSKPIDGIVGVVINAGDNNIVVATHNYNFEKDVDKGEALIYSIDDLGNILASAKVNKNGEFVVNDGTKEAARKDDPISSTSVEDAAFWTWVSSVNTFLVTLGFPPSPVPPTSLTGKITGGTDKVLLP